MDGAKNRGQSGLSPIFRNELIFMKLFFSLFFVPVMFGQAVTTAEKAAYLERDLIDKHLLEGLYVSMVPVAPEGTKLPHTVDDPGNVIHAGVWTGRYLAGVAYE